MDLAAHRSHDLGQAALDGHVDVLVLRADLERVRLDLPAHLTEAAFELHEVVGRDDLLPREHAPVRERLLDVERRQAVVEAHRRVQGAEERVLRLGEAGHGSPS